MLYGGGNSPQVDISFSFSRFPHSGGTRVPSADFFLEKFENKTLKQRVSVVIGRIVCAFPNPPGYFVYYVKTPVSPEIHLASRGLAVDPRPSHLAALL